MAREAWPNALNAQLFNIKVGVYFRTGLFLRGFIPIKIEVVFFRGFFLSATGAFSTLFTTILTLCVRQT